MDHIVLDATEPQAGAPDQQPAVVDSVCTTCKAADGGPGHGATMLAAIANHLAAQPDVLLRPVQCLGVCKRPTTVAVTSADGYTFIFGDLVHDTGPAAVAAFAQAYRSADYGLVPWRERAKVLRTGMVARIPPARWSPDDGRAPK
ncbi:MAG: hypothetical protein JWQ51_85 [Tardiphaga sp.]|nr:hypothetical protein [Tardiphaga sp.]